MKYKIAICDDSDADREYVLNMVERFAAAALDPIAEAEIYSKFNDIADDRTAIYISHRLSSCKFCDEIAVFHEGKVIEQGTHANLVADEKSKYYELWQAQAQYYTT